LKRTGREPIAETPPPVGLVCSSTRQARKPRIHQVNRLGAAAVDRAPGGWSRVLSGVRAVLVTDLFSDRSRTRARIAAVGPASGASEAGVAGPTLENR
jgi:hypothetical protein